MSTTAEQINELLEPIVEKLDLIIDRSSKPAALCQARDLAEQTIKADRLEGKVGSVIYLLIKLSFLAARPNDYKDLDLMDVIKDLHRFCVERML